MLFDMRGALLLQAQPWEMPKQWLCFYSVSGALRLGREQSGRSFRCWWNACRGILHAQLPSCAICFLLQCRWTSHHADMDHTDSQGARLASVDGETFGLRDVLTKNNNKSPTWFKKKKKKKKKTTFLRMILNHCSRERVQNHRSPFCTGHNLVPS